MRPLIHRTHTVTPHGPNTSPVSIDDFINTEAVDMTADHLRQLAGMTRQMREKLTMDQARQHFDLHEGTDILVRLLESEDVANCTDPLPIWMAEAGVASFYLLKGVDLIPDWLPEIGLTDDARVVARVLERNPELRS
ncbi:MAG: YkvA family protein [Terrimicrobiaceae bacterium]